MRPKIGSHRRGLGLSLATRRAPARRHPRNTARSATPRGPASAARRPIACTRRRCVAAAIAAAQAARTPATTTTTSRTRLARRRGLPRRSPRPAQDQGARAALRPACRPWSPLQQAYGGRPLSATLAGDATTDQDGAGHARPSRSTRATARSASTSAGPASAWSAPCTSTPSPDDPSSSRWTPTPISPTATRRAA